ncbi:MAG TPA: M1 family aminopeptidase [Bdellovibrionales bacterium]|nr:M1 family aminopeptidase [Bdellovibrionales bacterium]
MRQLNLAALVVLAGCLGPVKKEARPPTADTRVLSYELALEVDFQKGEITGTQTIRAAAEGGVLSELTFDAEALAVSEVSADGIPVRFAAEKDKLRISLQQALAAGSETVLNLKFTSRKPRELHFAKDLAFTTFKTSTWMIADDRPGRKAPFRLTLVLPRGYRSVASGEKVLQENLPNGLQRQVWELKMPHSSYVYGFAAGKLDEASAAGGRFRALYLPGAFKKSEMAKLLEATAKMSRFFEEKSGLKSPDDTYTQVFVPGGHAQEMAGFSVLGESYARELIAKPVSDRLIAHELAHRWWGNLVTCVDWSHFWLNEGLTQFMSAAWREHAHGRAAYDQQLRDFESRHQEAARAGHDFPLAYAGEFPNLRTKYSIVYSKGAIFVDRLRKEIGEEKFWAGLRAYTQKHAGHTVESRDFQSAMEQASGRELGPLFETWVYGAK